MTLRKVESARELARRRNEQLELAETEMEEAASAAMRRFLRRIRDALTPEALIAAAEDFPRSTRLFTLGESLGWWQDAVEAEVVDRVRSIWRAGYFDTRDGEFVSSSLAAGEDWIANVVDRLSRTATPTIPEQAFDTAREVLSEGMATGEPIRDISQRLAAEFDWDQPAEFWRSRLSQIDARIDGILDSIGPPGDPVREATRRSDPLINRLQQQRGAARQRIDRVESMWKTRATRIARTESTAAYNAGAEDAFRVEGAGAHIWMATADERTRPTHLEASGQCRPIGEPFTVGGVDMRQPGDPAAPPEEVINCRCTVVAAASCDEASSLFADVDEVIEGERERRAET